MASLTLQELQEVRTMEKMMGNQAIQATILRFSLEAQQHRLIDAAGNIPFRGTLSDMAKWVESQNNLSFQLNHVCKPLNGNEFIDFLNRITKRMNDRNRALKR